MNNELKQPKTIHEMLGMDAEAFPFALPTSEEKSSPQTPSNLPIANGDGDSEPEPRQEDFVPGVTSKESFETAPKHPVFKRSFLIYPIVFVVAFSLFYVVLNFSALKSQVAGLFTFVANETPTKDEDPIDFARYNKWIGAKLVHANDLQTLHPNEDPDGDGLVNSDEFYLGTNPFQADTDRDNLDDGQEVLNGSNPLYAGRLQDEQAKIIAAHIDMDEIASRKRLSIVAGESIVGFQVNTQKPGVVEIPKINVNAPVIWTQNFENMEQDLKNGAAHHPATPFPGNRGTVSIHGHSSGNIDDGNFKTVFTQLNFLQPGDEIFVTIDTLDGKEHRLLYVVRSARVYERNDPMQFADYGGYYLNLSTSWPVGTARQRYVVTSELVGL